MIITTVMFALAMTTAAQEFGRDDRWVSGWGMGVSEAVITHGPGNEISVTCGEGQTGIRFTLAGDSPDGFSTVLLTFDKADPSEFSIKDGKIETDCHACASQYDAVIAALKRHSWVNVRFPEGQNARFTLTGSSAAIAPCIAEFWK